MYVHNCRCGLAHPWPYASDPPEHNSDGTIFRESLEPSIAFGEAGSVEIFACDVTSLQSASRFAEYPLRVLVWRQVRPSNTWMAPTQRATPFECLLLSRSKENRHLTVYQFIGLESPFWK